MTKPHPGTPGKPALLTGLLVPAVLNVGGAHPLSQGTTGFLLPDEPLATETLALGDPLHHSVTCQPVSARNRGTFTQAPWELAQVPTRAWVYRDTLRFPDTEKSSLKVGASSAPDPDLPRQACPWPVCGLDGPWQAWPAFLQDLPGLGQTSRDLAGILGAGAGGRL